MTISSNAGGYQVGDGNVNDVRLTHQGAPAAHTAAADPLAVSDVLGGLITYTSGGAANLKLPTVANLEATLVNARLNSSFDFSVIALGAGTATLVTNTGWTLVGNVAIAQNIAKTFRARKTGSGTWSLYQIG